MQSLTINRKAQKITFNDQNKNMVYLLRFVFGLNLVNAIIFFLLFNNQDDILKWLWLLFALMNIVCLYFALTKLTVVSELKFEEIQNVQRHSILGILFKLKNGKLRKVFIQRNSEQAEKLIQMFPKS